LNTFGWRSAEVSNALAPGLKFVSGPAQSARIKTNQGPAQQGLKTVKVLLSTDYKQSLAKKISSYNPRIDSVRTVRYNNYQ
jgi:hypothetical protein